MVGPYCPFRERGLAASRRSIEAYVGFAVFEEFSDYCKPMRLSTSLSRTREAVELLRVTPYGT